MEFDTERLEQRKLLAADISLNNGILRINGDNNANLIRVSGIESPATSW